MTQNFLRRVLPIVAIAIPATVHAHPGHGILDVSAGLMHPLLGADHLLAMVAIGLLGAQLGGRSRWAVPAAFVGSLAAGAILGAAGLAIPGMEHGIALSVLVLGAILAFALRLSLPVAAGLMAVCGLCHGAAHGVEMPTDATGVLYGAGFIAASIALHVAGVALGQTAIQTSRASWVRYAGAAVAVIATGMFLS